MYFSRFSVRIFLALLTIPFISKADPTKLQAVTATTSTISAGNWSTAGNWSAGIPGSSDIADINNAMTINTNITIGGGGYYTFNSTSTDATGGTAYTLSLSGSSSHGIIDVKANTTFEGICTVSSKGEIIVRNGATLTVGASTFANGSFITVEAGGTLIINGDLTNNNNSNNVTIDGTLIVNGNFDGGNGSAVIGTGSFVSSGSMTTSGSGTIFGSGTSCSSNCSANSCSFINTISPAQIICSGQTPSVLTGSTTASSPVYLWESCTTSATGTFTSASGTNNTANYNPPALTQTTWYRRKVTSGTCSFTSYAIPIIVTALPSISGLSASGASYCLNASATALSVTATGIALSYQWYSNTTASTTGGTLLTGATSSSYTPLTISAGTLYYYCVVTSSSCSVTSAVSGAIIINTAPSITSQSMSAANYCPGDAASALTVTATGSSLSYQWYSNTTASTTGGLLLTGATSSSYTPLTTVTGTLYYYCQVSGTCTPAVTSAISGAIVTATSSSASITAAGPTAFCSGGSVTLNANTGAGFTYQWKLAGSNISGATASSYSANATGNYRVVVTTGSGCVATSSPFFVNVYSLPAATITAGGPTTFCSGGNVTLTSSAGSSYLWSNGATTSSINATSSGNYSVSVTDANGCSVTSAATSVTVNALPTATITAAGPTTFCSGGNVVLTSSAGSSYLWSTGATTSSITVSASGSYTVKVTNAAGCSATSSATSVTVNALPTASITAGGPTTFCSGGNVVLTSSAGSSYLWSTGATTSSITVSASGSYTVKVTNAAGCSATSSATSVTVNALPTASITAGGPTTFCSGGNVTLTSSAGSYYLWSNGATTSSITVAAAGSYTVQVTNAAGCSATSSATSVIVNALPTATITAGGPTTFCSGGNVVLTSSAGSSYLWSTGATTSSITVAASGSYTVKVTNAAGCSATSAATSVTVNALPTATITAAGPTTFCSGGNVVLTSSAGSSYTWSTGAVTPAIIVSASGSYTVQVTGVNGCSAISSPTIVNVNALPVPVITAGGSTTFCVGGNVSLSSSNASSFLWSNGATSQSITVNNSGVYTVSVVDANGCSGISAPVTTIVNALPVPTITAGAATTFCAGGSVSLTSSAGSSYLWSNGAVTASISANIAGAYTVTVTDANGCVGTSASTLVTLNALPVPSITADGPTVFCSGDAVNLSSDPYPAYLWSTGSTAQSIHVNAGGIYTVTVTDGNGCSGTSAPQSVTVNSCLIIWTGSVSSDWNAGNNWNSGFIPAGDDDIKIPALCANYPVITGSITVHNLTIDAGVSFTLGSGAVLNITGNITNNGTFTDNGGTINFIGTSLQSTTGSFTFNHVNINNVSGVKINNTITVAGILSLINGQLNSGGNLTMDLNTGFIAYNGTDNGSISGNIKTLKNIVCYKTHYLSSPLNGTTGNDFADNTVIIDPTTLKTRLFSWGFSTQSWLAINNINTSLNLLSGYSVYFTNPTSLDFNGTYTHSSVPYSMSVNATAANQSVLVGNPYPSTIDWESNAWSLTNVKGSVTYWDACNGKYASYTVGGVATNGATRYIPPMQAFYLKTIGTGAASVNLNNNVRTSSFNPSIWKQGTPSNTLKLTLSSGTYSDETVIRFHENAVDGFDNQLDAPKFRNPDLVPSFYSVTENEEYAINTLPHSNEKNIPLHIESGFAGTYTIHANELGPFTADYTLILQDKLLNKNIEILSEDYTFSLNKEQSVNRFSLIYKNNPGAAHSNKKTIVSINSDGQNVKVDCFGMQEQADIYIYNSIGQLISRNSFDTRLIYSEKPQNIIPGIYIVKVVADGQAYFGKVYLSE